MRLQLKHILPLALVLTGVAAKTTDESSGTAVQEATATDDSASATATGKDEESTATETGSDSTATGDSSSDDNSSGTGKKTTAKATKTTAVQESDTWVASIPSTTAPDLEATGSGSLMRPNFIIVSLSVGLLTAGMTFL